MPYLRRLPSTNGGYNSESNEVVLPIFLGVIALMVLILVIAYYYSKNKTKQLRDKTINDIKNILDRHLADNTYAKSEVLGRVMDCLLKDKSSASSLSATALGPFVRGAINPNHHFSFIDSVTKTDKFSRTEREAILEIQELLNKVRQQIANSFFVVKNVDFANLIKDVRKESGLGPYHLEEDSTDKDKKVDIKNLSNPKQSNIRDRDSDGPPERRPPGHRQFEDQNQKPLNMIPVM